jgi:ATP phosphoribosyltransferase regulatory subunit
MTNYGYQPTELPLIEPAEVFLTRAGDQLIDKLFTFERHGISLALRPEFTSSALRRYIKMLDVDAPNVARWQFSGVIFEDDPANTGTDYERMSVGAECIGLAGVAADAEIIQMAVGGCTALGVPVQRVVLGNIQLVRYLLAHYGLDSRLQQFILSRLNALSPSSQGAADVLSQFDAYVGTTADGLDLPSETETQLAFEMVMESTEHSGTMGGRTQADIARRLLQKHQRASQRDQVAAALDKLTYMLTLSSHPSDVIAALRNLGINDDSWLAAFEQYEQLAMQLLQSGLSVDQLVLQPAIARNWDYYSGTVFELYAGAGKHLAGGGRYDEFARLIGAPIEIPAVGFVYYVDALLNPL